MQKEINNNEYWEGKRLQEARESASKNAIGLMDIGERLGLLKDRYQTIEDFYDAYSGVVNQLCENILKGINLKAEFKTAKQEYAKGEAEAFADADKDCCENCGNPLTEGEIKWQKTFKNLIKEDKHNAWCYSCKKKMGLIKKQENKE